MAGFHSHGGGTVTLKTLKQASIGYVLMWDPRVEDTEMVPPEVVEHLKKIGWTVKT